MTDKQSKLAVLPISRVRTIMRSSPDVGSISPESCFLITKAAEGFVAFLIRQALMASNNKTLIDYKDLSKVVGDQEVFSFLKDILPPRIKAAKYLELLKQVEASERRVNAELHDL
ncbi:chromatin accessibility complex protein 1 [Parasteatoda tepidariorum]|nr:chromatin accessibility complex protein 1 [Parasteatoda tepidariorum]